MRGYVDKNRALTERLRASRAAIQALKNVEAELRQLLVQTQHQLLLERSKRALQERLDGTDRSEDGGARELDTAQSRDKLAACLWRDCYIENMMRQAHPRALSGCALPELPSIQNLLVDTAELVDSWHPSTIARISIVLATYNRIAQLQMAIRCLRDQRIDVPHEIIVVDGGSTDGTVEWLASQPDIITVVQHNRDAASGRRRRSWGYFINLGFKLAQGKWVCMISDDSLLVPEAVMRGVDHLEALEAKGRNIGGGAFYFRDWPVSNQYFVQHTLGGMLMVNHGLFLKEALIDVGYVEEELYSFYKADSDLSLKLWDAGYEIVDCPHSFVEHLLLPEEELRVANNKTMERDRHLLHERWAGRFTDRVLPEAFVQPHRKFVEFDDPHRTASLFSSFLAPNEVNNTKS